MYIQAHTKILMLTNNISLNIFQCKKNLLLKNEPVNIIKIDKDIVFFTTKSKQAGAELGQAQYKIGYLGELMSSASCQASIEVNFH